MTKPRCHSLAAVCVALMLVGLSACGGGTPLTGPSPSPTPAPAPVTTLVHDDSFAVGTKVAVPDTFTTTSTGTLDVTVDWTFASNDIDIFIARGTEPCTLQTFNDRTCGFIATEESTTMKPERLTIPNVAAGSYTLYVANFGSTNESVACHILLTTASAASVRSVSTGAAIAKGRVSRILERGAAN
jgi:hypothetical protein